MSKEAMKLALEALENAQANFGEWWPEAITALREALAEHCVCREPNTPGTHRTDGPCLAERPAQRTWVGLTDEEIEARAINFYNPEMYKRAVLWAQEKLKERNQ